MSASALPRRLAAAAAPAHTARRAAALAAFAAGCAGGCAGGCARARPAAAPDPHHVTIGVALTQRPGVDAVTRGATLALETLAADPRARQQGVRFALRPPPPGVPGAVAAAERLRDDATVIGVVGDAESGRTLDAVPVIEDAAGNGRRALVAVSPTATSPALAARSAWLFRLSPSDDAAARHVAAYARDSLRSRRAAVVYRADAYGRDWTDAFARAFSAAGGVVVARDPYVDGVTDWQAYAQALALVHPDVVLFPGAAGDAARCLRALRTAGVHAPLVGGDAVAPLADSAEFAGARYAAPFTAAWAASPGAPAAARRFAARYQTRYGERPGVRAALGYEAALLIGRAALAVDLAAPDRRRRVRDHLAALGRTRPAAEGVVGPIAFDAGHGVAARTVMIATVAGPRASSVAGAP